MLIDQHLLETGTMLLQGLPITTPEACEAFVEGMGFTLQKSSHMVASGRRYAAMARSTCRVLCTAGHIT